VIRGERFLLSIAVVILSEAKNLGSKFISIYKPKQSEMFRFAQHDRAVVKRLLLSPMILTFLGTRGEIDTRTRRHRMHTSLLVSYRGRRVMIDCGLDWLGKLKRVDPDAIVLTHAHPDHAWGLKRGAPCPVYATQTTWQELQHYPVKDRHVIKERVPTKICGITFEAFRVEHSILSPAVGYRVSVGRARIFYAPDLIFIHERGAALKGVQIYIGDGATVTQSFVRKRGKALIGHSPVRTQLTWCQKEGVPRAIITHCGSEIVTGDERGISVKFRAMAAERGIEVRIAYDGLKLTF
jgi:phosphoribosyl 1,2-cyclic phosphodiesterase